MIAWLLVGCVASDPGGAGVAPIVDPARSSHFFDAPFPDDALVGADGHVALDGFPVADGLLGSVVGAWVEAASTATTGFGATAPVWFRFEGPLTLPATTAGLPDDPVVIVDAETGERFPLDLAFVADPGDDPFLAPNTLTAAIRIGWAPRPGATLVAAVMRSAGAAAAELPEGAEAALRRAGVFGAPAVATRYTVIDAPSELSALIADLDARMDTSPGWSDVALTPVVRLAYAPGATPGGQAALVCTATLADGTEEVTWLAPSSSDVAFTVELDETWPMAVFVGRLPVWNYSGLDDRPYMRPGAAHLLDVGRTSGRIEVRDGAVVRPPDPDVTRVVVSVPRAGGGLAMGVPFVVWDHGSAGTAFNSVQRKRPEDDGRAIAAALAAEGWGVVARDLPLYGDRFDLVGAGFSDGSLGFFNIVNLPAFRDNQRQGGIEGHVVRRWVQEGGLAAALPRGVVDGSKVRRFGHSLGTVTAHLGIAAEPDAWDSGFVSGSGAWFALSFLETGLTETGGGLVGTLGDLFGVDVQPGDAIGEVIAAGLGIDDPDARARFDRLHPAVALFSWIVEASDPAATARSEATPVTVLLPPGDLQIPEAGTRGMARLLPEGEVAPCTPTADYDPHYCLFREAEGHAALRQWAAR